MTSPTPPTTSEPQGRDENGSGESGQGRLPGSARSHHTARRRLRKRLEAEGRSPEEITRMVELLREAQGRDRYPSSHPTGSGPPQPPKRSENDRRKRSLAKRDGEICHWCRAPLDITIGGSLTPSPPRATLDHVVARSLGGTTALANLVLSCEPCNAERGGVHSEGAFPHLVGLPSAKGQRSVHSGGSVTR